MRTSLAVAPFEVAVVPLNADDEAVMGVAVRIAAEVETAGVDVILDDRPARAGVKLADVELIGIPLRVTVGKRGVAAGTVELTVRATGETTDVAIEAAAEAIYSYRP